MMKIVITDGYTLNSGDLDWSVLNSLGELTIYDRTPIELIAERCKAADIILTNKVSFTKSTLQSLPNVKLICVLATGYNVIDVDAAKEYGVTVCNVPAYGTASVAQHTFALLLELTNSVGLHSHSVAQGEWVQSKDWCYTKAPLIELAGKTLGIVGFGSIGQQTAAIANAFGMKTIYYSRHEKEDTQSEYVTLNDLFKSSDVISLHCPLTPENSAFVNADLLRLVKSKALLINTSRGQLINEADLAEALNANQLGGAALDVLSSEPPLKNNPLLTAKNCLVTPHNAWMSREARERILLTTKLNIESFLHHKPVNIVSK